ncbi:hypothetical protein [Marinicella litoralis]|uniref:Uncharacterized protein n=1 Tax=Marinicella litoralis TaxID=644220 RepID=A0A4V3DHR9_9GAMM|nr:hypothetical protein [Marinicella litoralis]TDR19301.1 hypothetical protein C8D91_1849 [Marinicella litoralis]
MHVEGMINRGVITTICRATVILKDYSHLNHTTVATESIIHCPAANHFDDIQYAISII